MTDPASPFGGDARDIPGESNEDGLQALFKTLHRATPPEHFILDPAAAKVNIVFDPSTMIATMTSGDQKTTFGYIKVQ